MGAPELDGPDIMALVSAGGGKLFGAPELDGADIMALVSAGGGKIIGGARELDGADIMVLVGSAGSGKLIRALELDGAIMALVSAGGGLRHFGSGPVTSRFCSRGPASITACISCPFSGKGLLAASISSLANASALLFFRMASVSAAENGGANGLLVPSTVGAAAALLFPTTAAFLATGHGRASTDGAAALLFSTTAALRATGGGGWNKAGARWRACLLVAGSSSCAGAAALVSSQMVGSCAGAAAVESSWMVGRCAAAAALLFSRTAARRATDGGGCNKAGGRSMAMACGPSVAGCSSCAAAAALVFSTMAAL
jgi:hypothetical protein